MNLNFGVGSFSFETFPPGEANDNEWENKVRSLLESIPTIRDIEFEGIDSFDAPKTAIHGDWTPDGVLLTPHPCGGSLSYRLNIPTRIQREIVDQIFPDSRLSGAESFYVLTHYRGFPVTWVIPEIEASGISRGSQDVMIVRMFLEREVERYRPNDEIRFTFLSPSPFHCDFALRPSEEELPAPYKLGRIARVGGDELMVAYNGSTFEDGFQAVPRVSYSLSAELSFFYECERRRERRGLTVRLLQDHADELISMASAGHKIWASVAGALRSRRITRALSLQLIISDYDFRLEKRQDEHAWAGISGRSSRLFESEIEEAIGSTFLDDVENMNKIVELISSRQKRSVDMGVLFMTALLTGLIGSIIAIVLTAPSH